MPSGPVSRLTSYTQLSYTVMGTQADTMCVVGSYPLPGVEREMRSVVTRTAEAWTPERIKALRQRLGMTQSAFAETIGTRDQSVSDWERGNYRVGYRHAVKLGQLERQAEAGEVADAEAAIANPDIEALAKAMCRLLASAYERGQRSKAMTR